MGVFRLTQMRAQNVQPCSPRPSNRRGDFLCQKQRAAEKAGLHQPKNSSCAVRKLRAILFLRKRRKSAEVDLSVPFAQGFRVIKRIRTKRREEEEARF